MNAAIIQGSKIVHNFDAFASEPDSSGNTPQTVLSNWLLFHQDEMMHCLNLETNSTKLLHVDCSLSQFLDEHLKTFKTLSYPKIPAGKYI